MSMDFDADLVVIGGGPAGATVAAEVARRGGRVIVLEKRTGDSPSRAGVIQPRVLELLDSRGMMGRFREAAKSWRPDFEIPVYFYAGMAGLRYHELDTAHPYALILPQTATEHLLRAWAQESGAEIRRGASYITHEQDADGVTVRAVGEDGETVELRTRYLVGADGARSQVRKTTGIPLTGRDSELTAVSVDAVLSWPYEAPLHLARNENGWVLAYPFGEQTTRFIIVAEATRNVPVSVPPTMEEVRESLRTIVGQDFGVTESRWLSRYGDAHRLAPSFVDGRVALVGEATRVHYPASGMGMNYCIQDAFNLGWKLAFVIAGDAPESLVATYDTERHPIIREFMDDVAAQCALHFDFSPGGLALKEFFEREILPTTDVNEVLRDRVSGFKTTYHRADDTHPGDGTRLREFSLGTTTYNQVATVHDFVLIERAVGAPTNRSLPGRITQVLDTAGNLPANVAGAKAVLVRPDAYVAKAWDVVPTDEDIEQVYRRSTAQATAAEAVSR
ncbi:FAD-dependent monooxygenase [Rhodococcus fascians]|nr:FAD-dependent monooxygenase [Rhodococcus fascians]MBY4116490.1 FAD-dependent monooxygenase [Rhodococcus fascians]